MDKTAYEGFTAALLGGAERDPDILGIVFAGSTADASRRDEWSDHDFLMIVNPGQQERYRQDRISHCSALYRRSLAPLGMTV